MKEPQKYYEELYFNSVDDRELLPQNQKAIIELLDQNGAVGVLGVYDEPGYPIYFISGFALTAIGYGFAEMLEVSGGRFVNLVYEKDIPTYLQDIENPNLVCHEFRMVNKSGQNVWVNSYRKHSVSKDGKTIIIASIRVVEDARKRASELLDALTKGYNRIIYVDVNQGKYRIIKSERDDFDEQVCGTLEELEELLRQYGRDYINPEDHSFAEMLNKLNFFANPGEKGGNYQATYRAKVDNEYQWVQFQAFYGGAMNLDTGHIILAFRVVDEEKRKELDTNRLLSDSLSRAEEADRVKNRFLSRMSHDLRTPINGIIGMLEIMKQNRTNPEKIDDCVGKIAIACDNLMSLVQDVLDMNTLESGKLELEEETLDLYDFLTEKMRYIYDRAEMRGLTCDINVQRFAHPNILGSPRHIRQIFEYIVDNAIKYNKLSGSISMTAQELSKSKQLATYEFVVEDTGIGMEEEFVNHIFEPFEQEHNEARTQYMGTGLGMSIVKRLVDQMNGEIRVESRLGEGTRVIFTIPFMVNEDAAGAEGSGEVDLAGRKVLLVEDNEINMEIAQFLLESAGMTVACAVNGQEAVDIFRGSGEGEISVVLMDIMMPVMNGLEAARAIRSMDREDAGTVSIIALSANVMDSDIKKTRMAGMDEHLAKPIDAGRLLDSIKKCLRR